MRFLLSLFPWLSRPVLACELALLLAVDVSGSVDREEYRIQMDGLALGLLDGIVAEALIDQRAHLSLLQWTGASRQQVTLDWVAIETYDDLVDFADRVSRNERVWRNYSTAIGEALVVAETHLAHVDHCLRKVIDVSGDGVSNEGLPPRQRRDALQALGVTVNAIAIETDDVDLTAYFFEHVIAGEGAFVVTADGFEDYPRQIRRKLQRETTKQLSVLR